MSTKNSTRGELAKQLRKRGVQLVTAAYDGSGDSGQLETPEFGVTKVPGELVEAVQNLFYDFLEELYGGWEINEGSCGTFEWDLKTDKINLAHYWRTETLEEQTL